MATREHLRYVATVELAMEMLAGIQNDRKRLDRREREIRNLLAVVQQGMPT